MVDKARIVRDCRALLQAYREGMLGDTTMPEDTNPGFGSGELESRLSYFTLPMTLNYQRDSYRMWASALQTYNDPETRYAFDISRAAGSSRSKLGAALAKHGLAVQPNRHTLTWHTICRTVSENWGSLRGLMEAAGSDYVDLRGIVQGANKRGFPYLSGPKIFNYWSFVLKQYCGVPLKSADLIEIAPDTHIIRCSVRLDVITEKEATRLSREEISERWRSVLKGSGINPIDMHPPLWFWDRNGFRFEPPS